MSIGTIVQGAGTITITGRSGGHDPAPAPEPRRPIVVLFLAANPDGVTPLALDAECAAIQRELDMSRNRDGFDFRSRWAVTIDDLIRVLDDAQPDVVHFSGHGKGQDGLVFHDERQGSRDLRPRGLAEVIASTSSPHLVVLNACFSDAHAEALRPKVPCVIGMRGAVTDGAARHFAARFYGALGKQGDIGRAFGQATASLAAYDLPDELLPICSTRPELGAGALQLPLDRQRRAP